MAAPLFDNENVIGVLYADSLSNEGGPVPTYLDLLRVTSDRIADGVTAGALQ